MGFLILSSFFAEQNGFNIISFLNVTNKFAFFPLAFTHLAHYGCFVTYSVLKICNPPASKLPSIRPRLYTNSLSLPIEPFAIIYLTEYWREQPVAVSLAFLPCSLVNITRFVFHNSLSMHDSLVPITAIQVATLKQDTCLSIFYETFFPNSFISTAVKKWLNTSMMF